MSKWEQKPIKIALFSMDERSAIRMATLFKVVYKERCEVVDGEQAGLAIVDLDGDAKAWVSFRQKFPKLPAIVLSESPSTAEGAVYISKPAKLDLLWESILRLVIGLPSPDRFVVKHECTPAVVTTNDIAIDDVSNTAQGTPPEPVQPTDALADTGNSFNPGDYLLGHLLACLEECVGRECSISVRCEENQQFVLFPREGRALSDLGDIQFERLSKPGSNKAFTFEINSTDEDNGEVSKCDEGELHDISLDYLLWGLAQWTARGRVPVGTDPGKLFYLRRWPNFSRLPQTSHGMRIAALWVGEPRSLDDIATSLGINKTEVYSFYSSAVAIGLAGLAKRQVDGLIEPRSVIKKDIVKRNVRNAILRHIGDG